MCSSQCSVNYEAFSLGGSQHSPSPVWAPGTISLILLVASFPGLRASSQACDDQYSAKYSRGPPAVLQRVLCTPLLTLVLSLVSSSCLHLALHTQCCFLNRRIGWALPGHLSPSTTAWKLSKPMNGDCRAHLIYSHHCPLSDI